MTYTIDEKHLQAFKDILEVAQSEILEPTHGKLKMTALTMTENGITMIDLIKKTCASESVWQDQEADTQQEIVK